MKSKLLQIVSFYGIRNQLKYIHSEYFELDEAIIETQNKKRILEGKPPEYVEPILNNYRLHIAEEISDIMVMLKQIQYYYGITDDEIRNIMQEKIERQLRRIEEECHTTSK